ncbi:MAG: 4-hydroxythreonine-4-phosphate dehydrogenase PdxA [Treponema sp.]|jgi:4-hydroxythreonine-4-phosphate dehydrogenase|nr:4-hydroxythreonine-4-phosphate dehydrogenase PdxA [Treponema sp.]
MVSQEKNTGPAGPDCRETPRPVLGISIGDPAGIGPEITVKALSLPPIYERAIPLVYADRIVLEDALELTGENFNLRAVETPGDARGEFGTIDFIDAGFLKGGDYAYGQVRAVSGEAAFRYVVAALRDALAGATAAVVTGPINKEAINLAGHHFPGHTEIFAHYTNTRDYGMLLSAGKLPGDTPGDDTPGGLRVIHVTTHVSMREACNLITKDRVLKTINLAARALKLMGSPRRRIAVAGLNPHASEKGLFGDEEAREIGPAVEAARAEGLDVSGPVPPDTVFVRALGGSFDVVVAMYHDQGHIPLKLCGFRMDPLTGLYTQMSGVNTTIGLPIIRTSVDHGTAFDRAGKNLSNEGSMVEALNMAVIFVKNRGRI